MKAAKRLGIAALGTSMAVLSGPGEVTSQEPSPNVPVTQRPRPAYDALGMRAGGFLIYPSLTVSETYDDNIFAVPEDEDSDFITLVQPRIDVASNFVRHSLGFGVGSDIAFYADNTDENFQDVSVNADGRLDITRRSALSLSLDAGRFHESRDDPEDVEADELTEFYAYGGTVGFSQAFNRLNFRLSQGARRTDFQDAGDFNNDDRDRIIYDTRLRTGFFISPRFNTFVEGRYNIVRRDEEVDDDGFERDEHGWGVNGGVAVDITAILFGEAFVGYRRQHFEEDEFDTEDGISFGADLTWNPTTLTTLVLSGSGDFEPTNQADAASNFESSIALAVDHELLRNVLIGATVGFERDDFESIDRTDDTIIASGRVTYLLNRNFSLRGDYQYTDRSSDFANEEFTRNRFTLSLTAQL